jgi:hypothetical protein
MHGHELDPIISDRWESISPFLRPFIGALEFRSDTCLVTSDAVSDFLGEMAEKCLRIWHGITGNAESWASPAIVGMDDESMTRIKRPLRTRNMLTRFYHNRREGLYDIAVTGHTHKAGHFQDWYFNSGCWTQKRVSFLKISPEGRVQIFYLTEKGTCRNLQPVLE